MPAPVIFLEHRAQAQAERAVLGIAEGHLDGGREGDVEIHDAQPGIGIERHHARLCEQHAARQIGPLEGGGDRSPVLAAHHVPEFAQHDLAAVGGGIGSIVVPEIQAVHLLMAEPESPLVQVVFGVFSSSATFSMGHMRVT